jgi:hypothetical protein
MLYAMLTLTLLTTQLKECTAVQSSCSSTLLLAQAASHELTSSNRVLQTDLTQV